MNARQENKLSNYLARKALLDQSTAITGTIPALAAALTEWNGTVALIQVLGNKQGANLTGIAAAKAELRALMATRAMIVRNKVGPFAHVSGDAALAAQVDVTLTDILHEARDTEADDHGLRILEAARAHEAALVAGYGLTTAQLDDLESAIEGFSALIGKPQAAIHSRKTGTEQLDAEFEKADATLANVIDPLIFSLELAHADFVANYRAARGINDTHPGGAKGQPAPPANP